MSVLADIIAFLIAHLRRRIVKTHDLGAAPAYDCGGRDKRVTKQIVEPDRDVSRQFNVLNLILPHGYQFGIVK
jgi:hypothetical protein